MTDAAEKLPPVEYRVKKLIMEHLGADADKVTNDASLIDLGADSLDHVELMLACEEEFDVQISDDVAEQVQTVGAAVKAVEAAIEGRANG